MIVQLFMEFSIDMSELPVDEPQLRHVFRVQESQHARFSLFTLGCSAKEGLVVDTRCRDATKSFMFTLNDFGAVFSYPLIR